MAFDDAVFRYLVSVAIALEFLFNPFLETRDAQFPGYHESFSEYIENWGSVIKAFLL